MSGKHHVRHSQMLGCRNSDSLELFKSNRGGSAFFDYVVVDFENVSSLEEEVSGKHHFRHSQMLGCRNSESLDLFESNVGGYAFFSIM